MINWENVNLREPYDNVKEVMNSELFHWTNRRYRQFAGGKEFSFLPKPLLRLKKMFVGDEEFTVRKWNQIDILFAYFYGRQNEYKSALYTNFRKILKNLSLKHSYFSNLTEKQIKKIFFQFYEKIIADMPNKIQDLYPHENFDLSAAIFNYLKEDTKMLEKFYSKEKVKHNNGKIKSLSRAQQFIRNTKMYPLFYVEEKLLTTLMVYRFGGLNYDVNTALEKHYEIMFSKIKSNHRIWNKSKTISYLHWNLLYLQFEKYPSGGRFNKNRNSIIEIEGEQKQVSRYNFYEIDIVRAFDLQYFNEYTFPGAYIDWKFKFKPMTEHDEISLHTEIKASTQISEEKIHNQTYQSLTIPTEEDNLQSVDFDVEIPFFTDLSKKSLDDTFKNAKFDLTLIDTKSTTKHYERNSHYLSGLSSSSTISTADTTFLYSPRNEEVMNNSLSSRIIEDYVDQKLKMSSTPNNKFYMIRELSCELLTEISNSDSVWATSTSLNSKSNLLNKKPSKCDNKICNFLNLFCTK
jgi:hypothetical protein